MYWRYGLLVSKNLKHDFLNDHFWIFDDHLQWHGIWNYLGLLAQHISFLLNHWWTVSNIKSVQFGHKWTISSKSANPGAAQFLIMILVNGHIHVLGGPWSSMAFKIRSLFPDSGRFLAILPKCAGTICECLLLPNS